MRLDIKMPTKVPGNIVSPRFPLLAPTGDMKKNRSGLELFLDFKEAGKPQPMLYQ